MSTYAHELSHNLVIPDNYGNPYATIQQRGFTGMWDMMSRGTFNGPGGPHTPLPDPADAGLRARLAAQHPQQALPELRHRRRPLRLNRNGLAQSGLAVADVTAREVPHTTGEVAGVRDRARRHGRRQLDAVQLPDRLDAATACALSGTTVTGKYNAYTMEVVQQIGSDSFDPGHGVLITKTKNGAAHLRWLELLRLGHRLAPGGHQPRRLRPPGRHAEDGDARRRAPAQRRARSTRAWTPAPRTSGPTSGTACTSTWSTRPPTRRASCTTRSPSSRSTAPARRRAAWRCRPPGSTEVAAGQWSTCTFPLKNTGAAATTDPALHPQDETSFLTSDVYRLSASATGTGWSAKILNALTAVKFGDTVKVPVYVTKATNAAPTARSP